MQPSTSSPPADISAIMRTLADPTRRSLYEAIVSRGEVTVASLVGGAPISQPAVSQHLKVLREAGLVSERRSGRNAFYAPNTAGLAPLLDWLDYYGAFWRDRLTSLRGLLQEIDPK